MAATTVGEMLTRAELDLRLMMRKLWEDHVIWARCYIVSLAAELKDSKVTAQRIRRNQEDIGNVIKPFFGEAAGNELSKLLLEHITGGATVMKAAKAGNAALMEEAERSWYANADQIATFLSSINPYWPEKEMQDMLYEHLHLSKNEAVERLGGDYAGDIARFDEAVSQIIEISDIFSDGIVRQFPEHFGRQATTRTNKNAH